MWSSMQKFVDWLQKIKDLQEISNNRYKVNIYRDFFNVLVLSFGMSQTIKIHRLINVTFWWRSAYFQNLSNLYFIQFDQFFIWIHLSKCFWNVSKLFNIHISSRIFLYFINVTQQNLKLTNGYEPCI